VASDDTGATTYTSDTAQSWSAAYTPSYDDSDPVVAKNAQVLFGTAGEVTCFEAPSVSMTISNTKADILSICAESGKSGSIFTKRDNTIELTGYLTQHQADEFERYRSNTELVFTYNFGQKSGGNWVAGKAMNFHFPQVRIQEFTLTPTDGVVTIEMTLKPFVSGGLGEVYINQL
jgi:hypothetical protein